MVELTEIVKQDGHVEVTFAGHYQGRPTEYTAHLDTVLGVVRQHGCDKVLLDSSRVRYSVDILTEHALGLIIAEHARQPYLKLAVIAPATLQPHRTHLENVAVNLGADLRTFWSREEALLWLLG